MMQITYLLEHIKSTRSYELAKHPKYRKEGERHKSPTPRHLNYQGTQMRRTSLLSRKVGTFFKNVGGMHGHRYRDNQRARNKAADQGLLGKEELGEAFTERSVYLNKTNPTTMLRYNTAVNDLSRRQTLNSTFSSELDDEQLMKIEREGGAKTSAQKKMQSVLDAEALGIRDKSMMPRGDSGAGFRRDKTNRRDNVSSLDGQSYTYSNKLHRVLTRETPFERKQRILANNDIEPSEKEFVGLMRRLAIEDEDADTVEHIQERLVEENGVYASMRIDAYMLGDESVFPPWVHQLAPAVRDRVKYSGIGLTEDDEALRLRLSKMPLDSRRVEWARMKAARSYAEGVKEQKLSPYDIHAARLAKHKYFRLQAQRQHRATLMKRMALRKPDAVDLVPSRQVDYSARLATIAQFVENGVETKGQWPLDANELQRAKIRNKQEEAERTFMRTADERKMLRNSKYISQTIGSALESLDDKVREYKRVSRKTYAHRVNNILQGAEDDLGRRNRSVLREAHHRPKAQSNVSVNNLRRHGEEPEPHARRFTPRRERKVGRWTQQEGLSNNSTMSIRS